MTCTGILVHLWIGALFSYLFYVSSERLPPVRNRCRETHMQTILREPTWYVPIKFLSSELRKPHGKGGRKEVRTRGVWRASGRQGSPNQPSKSHTSSQRLKRKAQAYTGLDQVFCVHMIAFVLFFNFLHRNRKV